MVITHEPGAPVTSSRSRWVVPARAATGLIGLALIAGGTVSVVALLAVREQTDVVMISQPVTSMQVQVGSGDVSVTAGAAEGGIRITAHATSALRRAVHTETVSGGVLSLNGSCTGGWPDNCSVDYDVVVPAGIDVQVHTGAGDERVSGTTGQVALRTGSGDVRLDDVSGQLSARTGSGDINGAGIRSAEADLRTGSGDIGVDFAKAPTSVQARTGSGDARLGVPDDGVSYLVSGKSGSGDRRVEVPTGDSARQLVVNTGSGDVLISPP